MKMKKFTPYSLLKWFKNFILMTHEVFFHYKNYALVREYLEVFLDTFDNFRILKFIRFFNIITSLP